MPARTQIVGLYVHLSNLWIGREDGGKWSKSFGSIGILALDDETQVGGGFVLGLCISN